MHGFGLTMICVGLLALHLATLQHRSDMLALQQQYPATETHRAPALLGLSRSSSACGATIKVRVLIQIAALYPRLTCRKGIRLPICRYNGVRRVQTTVPP
jgi:hypothetical protein